MNYTDENQRYIFQLMLKYKKRCELLEGLTYKGDYIPGILKDYLNR